MSARVLIVMAFTLALAAQSQAQCIEGNCFEGSGNFLFENGDKYKGLWRQGLPEGYGVYDFLNGDNYKGTFKAGLMDGRGTYVYKNGDKYVGMWKAGKMDGRGHFYWNLPGDLMSKGKFEGNFVAGVPQNFEIPETTLPTEPPKMK